MDPEVFSRLGEILEAVRPLAIEYEQLAGRPLGITGEMGEYQAARILGLKLSDARAPFDAQRGDVTIEIKSKTIRHRKREGSYRLGRINLKNEWTVALAVLMDEWFFPYAIYEADRAAIELALRKPGSKARSDRSTLSVSEFKSSGRCIWRRDESQSPMTKTQGVETH